MKVEWEAKKAAWKSMMINNTDEAAATDTLKPAEGEKQEKEKKCSFVPFGLSRCIMGKIVRVSCDYLSLARGLSDKLSFRRNVLRVNGKVSNSSSCLFAAKLILKSFRYL